MRDDGQHHELRQADVEHGCVVSPDRLATAGREPELTSGQAAALRDQRVGDLGQRAGSGRSRAPSSTIGRRRRRPRAARCRAGSRRAPGRRSRTATDSVAGDRVAAAGAEHLDPVLGTAVRAGEVAHVLDHARTRWFIIDAIVPARSATSDAAACGVVTTTTSAFGRCWPTEIGHVAGARRQVEQQDVEVAPVDVAEHLDERAVEHRAAPGDDLVAAGLEHADADHAEARAPGPA